MITHKKIRNTLQTIGLKAAITRCKKSGLDLPVALYWLLGPEAVRRFYGERSI